MMMLLLGDSFIIESHMTLLGIPHPFVGTRAPVKVQRLTSPW